MKRKVFEDPLSFPSKSRRLDGELLQVSIEEPRNIENVDGLETERALVVYSPTNTPFLRSPTSPDFSFIVNSDLVPGLKDVIFWSGNSNKVRPADDRNDCLAIVPWVESQFQQAPPTESELMESEDVDMMDTEDYENCETVEANTGLQFRQQQQNQQHFGRECANALLDQLHRRISANLKSISKINLRAVQHLLCHGYHKEAA